jgi:BolA protein
VTYHSRITTKLETAFAPTLLEVIDESHLHAGHAGARPEGETHFAVRIAAMGLTDTTRVAAHRAIYAVLEQELAERVHALRIEVL